MSQQRNKHIVCIILPYIQAMIHEHLDEVLPSEQVLVHVCVHASWISCINFRQNDFEIAFPNVFITTNKILYLEVWDTLQFTVMKGF